jgi:hypothetical protein
MGSSPTVQLELETPSPPVRESTTNAVPISALEVMPRTIAFWSGPAITANVGRPSVVVEVIADTPIALLDEGSGCPKVLTVAIPVTDSVTPPGVNIGLPTSELPEIVLGTILAPDTTVGAPMLATEATPVTESEFELDIVATPTDAGELIPPGATLTAPGANTEEPTEEVGAIPLGLIVATVEAP